MWGQFQQQFYGRILDGPFSKLVQLRSTVGWRIICPPILWISTSHRSIHTHWSSSHTVHGCSTSPPQDRHRLTPLEYARVQALIAPCKVSETLLHCYSCDRFAGIVPSAYPGPPAGPEVTINARSQTCLARNPGRL